MGLSGGKITDDFHFIFFKFLAKNMYLIFLNQKKKICLKREIFGCDYYHVLVFVSFLCFIPQSQEIFHGSAV